MTLPTEPLREIQLADILSQLLYDWAIKSHPQFGYQMGTSKPFKLMVKQLKHLCKDLYIGTVTMQDITDQGVAVLAGAGHLNEIVQPVIDVITNYNNQITFDDEINWVASWGITQHGDYNSDITILIPVCYKHYTFAYTDYDTDSKTEQKTISRVPKQSNWNQLPAIPVVFATRHLHSLAPHSRPSKPFVGVIIDLFLNDQP